MFRIISDRHNATGQPYHWTQPADRDRQVLFIDQTPADCMLVLNGDGWDGWSFPYNIRPPTFLEVVTHPFGQPVVEACRRRVGMLTVLAGNHDQRLTGQLLATILPDAHFIPTGSLGVGSTVITHGHLQALMNAPDWSVAYGLPLGYHLTRLATACGGPSLVQEMELLAEIPTHGLPVAILDVLRKRAGLEWSANILMPDDLGGGQVSLSDVRDRYEDLVGRWDRFRGVAATIWGLPAELGHLEPAADQLFLAGAKTVIMGHTHVPVRTEHLGLVYANSGSWCCGQGSWVGIDDNGTVTLHT